MIKEELSQIIKLKKEINQLRQKLQELNYGDNDTIVTDKVRGSMTQFPYLPRSFTITGKEEMSDECLQKRNEVALRIRTKTQKLMEKVNKAFEYIESIEDSSIRQILTYRYIDGLTWEQTGEGMSYSWETVRKKHDKFIKSIPNNTSIYDVK
ncbi:MAG: RNA polymerase subunit sigma-24 [Ruminiclostridium sp.]